MTDSFIEKVYAALIQLNAMPELAASFVPEENEWHTISLIDLSL